MAWILWTIIYLGILAITRDWASGLVFICLAWPLVQFVRRIIRGKTQGKPGEPVSHLRRIGKISFRIVLGLLVLALFAYCYGPFIVYACMSAEHKQAAAVPVRRIDKFPAPPKEWKHIRVGNISLRLPMGDLQGVFLSRNKTFCNWSFNDLSASVHGLALDDLGRQVAPLLDEFPERVKPVAVTPEDLSIVRPSSNLMVSVFLTLKGASLVSDCFILERPDMKILVTTLNIKAKERIGFMYDCFHPDGKAWFGGTLVGWDGAQAEKCLSVLGGLEVLNESLDEGQYRADVSQIHAPACGLIDMKLGDHAYAVYGGWQSGMEFVLVFHDELLLQSTSSYNTKDKGAQVNIGFQIPGGSLSEMAIPKFIYQCLRETCSMSVGDMKYPLSDGIVFLSSLNGNSIRTQQVEVAINPEIPWRSKEVAEAEIRRVIESTPAIRKFVEGNTP